MTASVLSVLLALSVLGQGPGASPPDSPTSPAARSQDLTPRPGSPRKPRAGFLDVRPGPGNPADAPALRRRLADRLTGAKLPPPAERIAYYGRANPPGFPTIAGWEGMIEDVRPIAGGYVVTLRISALFDAMQFDSLSVRERYEVTDDGIRLVGFEGPPPGTPRVIFGV